MENLGRDGMMGALKASGNDADRADVALVYFAGHGVEIDHVNYLVPVDVAHQSFFDKLGTAMTAVKTADKVVVATPEQLLTKLRSDAAIAAIAARGHLTPTTTKIKVVFKDQARDLGKDDPAQFRSAVQFVRANRLDRACGIFETMLTPDKAKSVTLLYDLGACQEALEPDRPETALEYYNKADQQTTAPDRLVSEAALRVTALRDAMPAAARR